MTRRTKLRAVLAILIAVMLGGGYVIVDKEGSAAKEATGDSSFAAFH